MLETKIIILITLTLFVSFCLCFLGFRDGLKQVKEDKHEKKKNNFSLLPSDEEIIAFSKRPLVPTRLLLSLVDDSDSDSEFDII